MRPIDHKQIVLAIFPFENLTDANGLDILCKSFHIDLVTELSRFKQFRILSQKSLDENALVNTTYSIKGSFRFNDNKIRVNAQLINAENNQVAWADRFEGDKEALFSMQEKLLEQIVSTLEQQLKYELLTQIRRKEHVNLSAYEHWLYGMEELKKGTIEADEKARTHFEQAINIDPEYSLGYSGMSLTYFNEWSCQLWDRWDVSQKGAFNWAKKAIDLDEQNYVASLVLGRIYLYEADYDKAEHYLRKALRQNPNDVDNLLQIASCFVSFKYLDEAEILYDRALQLNPIHSSQYFHIGSFIAFEKGEYDKCISLGIRSVAARIDFYAMLAAAYFHVGNEERMDHWWQVFLVEFGKKILHKAEINPDKALRWMIDVSPYRESTNQLPFWEHIRGEKVTLGTRVFKRADDESAPNCFSKENQLWKISYEGKSTYMPDSKGFNDIVRLLQNPGTQYHCAELIGSAVIASPEPVFDERAKAAYKRRIQELQEEIEWVERNNNTGMLPALQAEYDSIVEHVTVALGKKGKIRKANDPLDKARSAVTWRIRSAIQKIEQTLPSLGKHFTVSVKTGLFCSYEPERPVDWQT